MECIGRLKGLGIDLMSKHQKLEIEIDNDIREEYDKLKDKEKLRIRIVQYRKKAVLGCKCLLLDIAYKVCRRYRFKQSGSPQHDAPWIRTIRDL